MHPLAYYLTSQTIDYCERHDLTFWSEPVNAITNAGFLIISWYAWKLWRKHIKRGPHKKRVGVLVALLAAIGVGSFAFHTLATRWAMVLDLLPIALFVYAYLRILFLYIFGMSRRWVNTVSILFVFVSFICSILTPLGVANGSGGYIAALLLFSSVVIASYQKRKKQPDDMLFACLVFWISLFLRTMDNAWCAHFPSGTHFMWHTLNAIVLAFMMRFLILNLSKKRAAS